MKLTVYSGRLLNFEEALSHKVKHIDNKKNICADEDFLIETSTTDKQGVNTKITLLIELTQQLFLQGDYDAPFAASISQPPLDENYIVEYESESKISELSPYSGVLRMGANYSKREDYFSGLIQKTADFIIYVIGAKINTMGNPEPKSGIFYVESLLDRSVTAFYYPFKNISVSSLSGGGPSGFYSLANMYSDLFIDRGSLAASFGKRESISQLKTVSDINDIGIIYN